jgi:hypothetical protein
MDVWKADLGSTLELCICLIAYARSGNANLQSHINTTVRNPPSEHPDSVR